MTGPDSALLFMSGIALVSGTVVFLDWLARRKDRRDPVHSPKPKA
jgi:hypothetical protein